MNYRKKFEEQGKIFPCPNKIYNFEIRKSLISLQWAKTFWSNITDDGKLRTSFLNISIIETVDGFKIYNIIIYKLSIVFGFINS